MINLLSRHQRGLVLTLPALLLAGCSYRISDAEVLATTEPAGWYVQRDALPLELHGRVAGRSDTEIAALSGRILSVGTPRQRVTLYLDGVGVPPQDRLCEAPSMGGGAGAVDATAVTAALCDGTQAVSLVRGSIKPGVSDRELGADLRGLQAELFRILYETPPPA